MSLPSKCNMLNADGDVVSSVPVNIGWFLSEFGLADVISEVRKSTEYQDPNVSAIYLYGMTFSKEFIEDVARVPGITKKEVASIFEELNVFKTEGAV